MKTLIGAIALGILAVISYLAVVAFSGLAIATANSWVLGGNFSDAWHMTWSHQLIVVLWFVIFFVAFRFGSRRPAKRQ